jgi:small subunit ribosomal protein S15
MALDKATKDKIVENFRKSPKDTGSSQIQVAISTTKINELTEHLKFHPKDHSSRRGLLTLVSHRRKLLNYIKSHSLSAYREIVGKLSLRH